ncbi:MAG: peptidoglycan editing factor PgeF [Candidatus Zeuxoniibacter abyssi]|nr:MAG: peptidoglycan editing factor PgeF [Candidatus Persebacteraceae bacterium AB1(2)]
MPAFFTTRLGGVSDPPYHSLNLSMNVNDENEAVSENRLRIAHLLPNEPRWLRQAHGCRVLRAENINTDADIADASYSTTPGVVCAVLTADCAPVLLCDEDGDCVAAVHAGWRGLAVGIIENAVTALTTFSASDLIACIGPTISAAHYEVGDDVHRALCVTDDDKAHFTSADNGKWYADLPALAGRRLRDAGVKKIHDMAECTYSSPQKFYSARRNKTTGRTAALIWIPTEVH